MLAFHDGEWGRKNTTGHLRSDKNTEISASVGFYLDAVVLPIGLKLRTSGDRRS
jgi:hypothetical protein